MAHKTLPQKPFDKNDINIALLQTISAVIALREILLKETDALKATKTKEFMALQDEKVEVARRYESLVNALMSRGDDIKKADKRLKDQLQKLQDGFSTAANENRKQLERMRGATQKLGEIIMKSARKSAEKTTQFAYGSSGKMSTGTKTTLGVNERA